MSNTKKTTITLTPETKQKALDLSKRILGRQNLSGIIAYLIEREGG